MTATGLLFLAASWSIIIALCAFCVVRTLRAGRRGKESGPQGGAASA